MLSKFEINRVYSTYKLRIGGGGIRCASSGLHAKFHIQVETIAYAWVDAKVICESPYKLAWKSAGHTANLALKWGQAFRHTYSTMFSGNDSFDMRSVQNECWVLWENHSDVSQVWVYPDCLQRRPELILRAYKPYTEKKRMLVCVARWERRGELWLKHIYYLCGFFILPAALHIKTCRRVWGLKFPCWIVGKAHYLTKSSKFLTIIFLWKQQKTTKRTATKTVGKPEEIL